MDFDFGIDWGALGPYEILFRLVWASFLGALIGIEREWTQKSAGMRTHTLVALGSAVFTLISISDMTSGIEGHDLPDGITVAITRDPARISAQIVSGLGFIGGGALIRHGASVQGLTTAANLWMAGSLGMLAGVGEYEIAFVAALLVIIVLLPLGQLERVVFHKHMKQWNRLRLRLTIENEHVEHTVDWMETQFNKETIRLKSTPHPDEEWTYLTYIMDISRMKFNINDVAKSIRQLQGIKATSIRVFQDDGTSEREPS